MQNEQSASSPNDPPRVVSGDSQGTAFEGGSSGGGGTGEYYYYLGF